MATQLRNVIAHVYRSGERVIRENLHLYDPESKLIADSQRYWNRTDRSCIPGNAHWRGNGVFAGDDARWLAMGRHNLAQFARLAGPAYLRTPRRIVDWGCGGGANAVHFAPGAARYYGVDITAASLRECHRQLQALACEAFVPVQFEADQPEHALEHIPKACDLFFSTYVFEIFPTKEYGSRVLNIASKLLTNDGLAFIQIRYDDGTSASQPHRWGYAQNLPHMTTYRIEEFWQNAEQCGFTPQLVTLERQQAVELGERYAYFLLKKS
ncbi:class I SAM-dependent methyltransferase [Hymenobacter sp. BT491]|uniref:class I SAM-dependent methyltransferase n=1 Tax=Hymenobacter sp. BT491 TaxID=2766779 RepID=UPI0016535350|nr:class I SAM-dependent methyltransferase [Hymenobacter sp. BT491]MBC6990584.1 class I SAM-dependent methyltransferase [Hymenobacter sp. BT491]